ncbi:hypothetical protein [Marinifilum flexuosum]|uniref:Uncharacterized protein n=1 Tax=Marinifilum flexuosum TaxID=1117708 RepID=A0A419X3M5_9BACT|nr:hypothetical protein [Marinifilum flexuosum]RKE02321.1 hypothetical protein BXY64_2409 [Marinifilum flexuosum]
MEILDFLTTNWKYLMSAVIPVGIFIAGMYFQNRTRIKANLEIRLITMDGVIQNSVDLIAVNLGSKKTYIKSFGFIFNGKQIPVKMLDLNEDIPNHVFDVEKNYPILGAFAPLNEAPRLLLKNCNSLEGGQMAVAFFEAFDLEDTIFEQKTRNVKGFIELQNGKKKTVSIDIEKLIEINKSLD